MKIKKYKINQRNRLKIYDLENEVEFRTPESYLENKNSGVKKKRFVSIWDTTKFKYMQIEIYVSVKNRNVIFSLLSLVVIIGRLPPQLTGTFFRHFPDKTRH